MTDPRDWPCHDEDLSALYRSTDPVEPPAWLDERIVTAARAAVTAPAPAAALPRRSRWRRWTMPLAMAATVVLTVGSVRLVQKSAELESPRQEAKAIQSPTLSAGQAPGAADNVGAGPAAQPAVAPAAPPPLETFETAPRSQLEAAHPASPEPVAKPKAEQTTRSMAKPARSEPADAATRQDLRQDQPRARPPAQWLAEIAELRRLGHTAEAAAQLKAFRRQYPDYPLHGLSEPPR